MDWKTFLEDFQDHLAPKLDTYEQAIYLYVVRHSRLQGLDEIVVGLKSARHRMAGGIGTASSPMSEHTAYRKLQSLAAKGCVVIGDGVRHGTRIVVRLPAEIRGGGTRAPTARELKSLDNID